jgi:hypothetical protein
LALTHAYQTVCAQAGITHDQPATWSKPAPLLNSLVAHLHEGASAESGELAGSGYTAAISGGNAINIMDINLASENPWSSAAESLAAFVEAILGERLDAPGSCLVECYQPRWKSGAFTPVISPAGASPGPTLAALWTRSAHANPNSQGLAQVLLQYAYGLYADLFVSQPRSTGSAQLMVSAALTARERGAYVSTGFAWQVLRLV